MYMTNFTIYGAIFIIAIIIYFMFKSYFDNKYEIMKIKTHYNLLRISRSIGGSSY